MKYRILIINPWIYDFAAFNLWARPLGLFRVAEFLSSYDVDIYHIDCTDSFEVKSYGIGRYRAERIVKPALFKDVPRFYKRYGISIEEFKEKLRSFMPIDLVLMTSSMSYWYPGIVDAINIVRKTMGSVPVMLGGIYATLYESHAARISGADYIYSGSLSDNFHSALQCIGLKIEPIRLRTPYYRLGLYKHASFGSLLTSTGCPFRCSYCASHLLSKTFERRPVHSVVDEICESYDNGVYDFAFYDDALLYDPDNHIKPLLKAILECGRPIRLHAPNGLHPRFIDDDLASLMRKAGFTTIRLSFETVNSVRQVQTGGKVLAGDLVRSIKSLRRHGFSKDRIGVYLLYGLPGQSLPEVEESIAFVKEQNVRIHLAEFSPIKGTQCWDELVRQKTISNNLDPLLTNNSVFSFLYAGYDHVAVERIKINVKNYNGIPGR